MNLLFCCENYPPSVGGIQEVIRQIAERLAAKGHAVTVATGMHPARPVDVMLNGVRVLSFAVSGGLVKGMYGAVEDYQRFVVGGGFDAILIKAAQQWNFDALIPVLDAIVARKVFIPCGFSGFYQPAFRNYYRQMPSWMARFDALVFYSNDYRDIRLAREHRLKGIEILPNGADEREFADTVALGFRDGMGVGENDLLLLTVGSFTGAKGQWELARAFELARLNGPATLIINGNHPRRSKKGLAWQFLRESLQGRVPLATLVRRINARQGPTKRVIMSDLPRPDLVRAFKASDLFVLASYVEYSPLVLFEAAAAGTPFLATPAGNAEEIARWTGAGVICPAARRPNGMLRPDPLTLARGMETILGEPARLKQMGQSGRRAFLDEGFSWAVIVERYEAILSGTSNPKEVEPESLPSVTVAMPVFNAGKYLRLAVLSIVKQTYQNWELLIFDDGSTDTAFQDIADIHDARIKILRDGQNRGLATRLNEAIDMARSEYFARMDADDISYPERLARQVAALQNDDSLDLVATRAITIDEPDHLTGLFPCAISHQEICRQPWRGFYFPHPTWMGKTQWFRAHRYAAPAPYCCEDQELLLRSYHSSRFVTLNQILLAYRIRDDVDWQKLARTRLAIVTFQLRYFIGMKHWGFVLLAVASYAAKTGHDLFKRIFGGTFFPGREAQAKAVVDNWCQVLRSLKNETGKP